MRRLVVALGLSLLPVGASGQTFTFLSRTGGSEAHRAEVGGNLLGTQPIGIRDCATSELWSFQVNLTAGLMGIQYWLGTSASACATTASRYQSGGTGNPSCFPLMDARAQRSGTPTTTDRLEVSSQYLVAPLTGGDCRRAMATTSNLLHYLTVLSTPLSDMSVVGMTYQITVDLVAPPAPTGVSATPGERSVTVRWATTIAGTSTTTDGGGTTGPTSDLSGFWLVCQRLGGASDMDGGATDDGGSGSDGSTSDAGACGEFTNFDTNDDNLFVRATGNPGTRPFVCSDTLLPASSGGGTATGLDNGVRYRVAVVSQDTAGNRSTLAVAPQCVTPLPATDFWEYYRARGGRAEPGYCDTRPGARGTPGVWTLLGLGALAVSLRRGRR